MKLNTRQPARAGWRVQLHTISRASIRAKVARSSSRNSWSLSRRSRAIQLVSLP